MSGNPAAYPNLGFDPAQGVPDNVQGLVDALNRAKVALDEARSATQTVANADSSAWQGKAADAFRKDMRENLPKRLDKAQQSFGRAAGELAQWHTMLMGHQDTARNLEAEAAAAKQKLAAADQTAQQASGNADLKLAGAKAETDAELSSLQQRYDAAVGAVNRANADLKNAQDALKDIKRRAEQLDDRHDDDAKGVASRLDDADDIAPHKPKKSVWGSIKDAVKGAIDKLADAADVLAIVAGVLATAALIVGTGGTAGVVLLMAAGAVSAAAAAGHSKDLIQNPGDWKNWLSVGADVAGVIPGFGAAKSVVTGAVAGARAGTGVVSGAAQGFQAAVDAAKSGGANVLVNAASEAIEGARAAKNGLMIPLGSVAVTAEDMGKALAATGVAVSGTAYVADKFGVDVDTSAFDSLGLLTSVGPAIVATR
ncbi:hypothetical protein [Yinghuangia seranimata]|uniref:hypothetical protein n=1 Tax=Yinghuangia seranimata TaxID=408067 RepID=UPI00248C4F2D|nr:hypothetical protein [Yinghuangia seranimata]MDI2132295.1 hypothetical protein [Yinghuangia seranimata]